MTALHHSGRRAEALSVHERARHRLGALTSRQPAATT
ncbi:BTAD domain-containing putative transcriptional regulator [Streptomyces sp. AHA2]